MSCESHGGVTRGWVWGGALFMEILFLFGKEFELSWYLLFISLGLSFLKIYKLIMLLVIQNFNIKNSLEMCLKIFLKHQVNESFTLHVEADHDFHSWTTSSWEKM